MNTINRLILIFICCLMLMFDIHAQDTNQKIDEVMAEFVKLEQFSGIILVAKDGEVLY